MTVEEILKSRSCGPRFTSLLAEVGSCAYPGKWPASRTRILARLRTIDGQTQGTLDTFATEPHALPSIPSWGAPERYMLKHRLLNALDILSRLAYSSPSEGLLRTTGGLKEEDDWLFRGLWYAFGSIWMERLAESLSRGLPQPQPPPSPPA
jgi:hypothetical protein